MRRSNTAIAAAGSADNTDQNSRHTAAVAAAFGSSHIVACATFAKGSSLGGALGTAARRSSLNHHRGFEARIPSSTSSMEESPDSTLSASAPGALCFLASPCAKSN